MERLPSASIIESNGLPPEILAAIDSFECVALEFSECEIFAALSRVCDLRQQNISQLTTKHDKYPALTNAAAEVLGQDGINKIDYRPEVEANIASDPDIVGWLKNLRRASRTDQPEIRDKIVRKRLAIAFGRFAVTTSSQTLEPSGETRLENAS